MPIGSDLVVCRLCCPQSSSMMPVAVLVLSIYS
jgi:hypothetical protein